MRVFGKGDLARAHDAALMLVHAWMPSGSEFAAWQFPSYPLVLQWQDDAWQRLWHALDSAFGGLPQDKIRRSMELFAREVMPRFR